MSKQFVSRRNFMKGLAATGIGAAAIGLAGCSPATNNESNSTPANNDAEEKTFDVIETFDCDICVVGAGASGLAAAVQAAELGANVICIDSQAITGGNINGVEGCFGVGSRMQKEKGIEVDPGAVIRSELSASQMRASGPGYVDMVHASGDNIDWLIDNGVQFGDVDADKGDILVFHRFPSGHGKSDYAEPMTSKAEALGVTFKLGYKAHTLIKTEGAVTGIYADGASGTAQINAKSVIVATGGFAQNTDLMKGVSQNPYLTYGGFDGHDGSGHLMCVDAGARSYRSNTALLVAFDIEGTPGYYDGGLFAFVLGVAAPYAVWVNQNGERFINEDCGGANAMGMFMPMLNQEECFCIMSKQMMDLYGGDNTDTLYEQIEEGIKFGSIFTADSITELAKAIEVDQNTMMATFDEYNKFALQGSDKNYGKDPSALIPFEEGPFYALRVSGGLNSTIGSIYTDRNFHALDENMNPISGLYVVGVEGAMLWANIYTINVSGGCNANNVNSGRTAAKDACANL